MSPTDVGGIPDIDDLLSVKPDAALEVSSAIEEAPGVEREAPAATAAADDRIRLISRELWDERLVGESSQGSEPSSAAASGERATSVVDDSRPPAQDDKAQPSRAGGPSGARSHPQAVPPSRAAAMALSIAQSLWNMDPSKAGSDTPSGPPAAALLSSADSLQTDDEGGPLGSARGGDTEWVNVDRSATSPPRSTAEGMALAAASAVAAAKVAEAPRISTSGGDVVLLPDISSPRDHKAAAEALMHE